MNEKIKELALQAGVEFDDDLSLEHEPIYYVNQSDLAKFAELIVQEVFSKIEDERYQIRPPVIDAVLAHFGIKDEQQN